MIERSIGTGGLLNVWNWNCCRFTLQVFEESPESYLSPSMGAVWGYLGGSV